MIFTGAPDMRSTGAGTAGAGGVAAGALAAGGGDVVDAGGAKITATAAMTSTPNSVPVVATVAGRATDIGPRRHGPVCRHGSVGRGLQPMVRRRHAFLHTYFDAPPHT
jgi:hypothetical protein